ncbi:transposase [Caldicoprobacter algeriensis]|uniref:zinc ribbon domain-containing protein n=1 Tax=Caldicoprobacter algeriensis TaxID=699281 RepID=UPI00207A0909|nr:zinc ribbon domain-containing protein [Caldicoprobacter algeriensis]MCM8901067.1 transposase [Caldicoprobacter algeriensis]
MKSRLRTSLETPVAVGRFEPTRRECFACGRLHGLSLSDRVIKCDCEWENERDINAALAILRKGFGLSHEEAVGLDRPEVKPPEREAAARVLGSNPYIRVSFPR